MSTSLAAEDVRLDGMPTVDAATLDDIFASAPETILLLFFRGDPTRAEVGDIAVVLPQLGKAFAGRLRPAVVAASAEQALMQRCGVRAMPSLALLRADRTLGVIAKIQDWSVYLARIEAMLAADGHSAQQGATS
ncbi:hydrogenase-1 operon protein HyaE [Rhodopseudomonas rhenobacensis]|uniref:Hydrogenase expression/formation protein n=1 Tax=Rhodopseudomonas rhenobacensis TaxID=87461 RepID=A0A7W7Z465_9BRAD|nr:hydrogenase accessory protein [Rhodopseudomonas rhenobacensis]MBB5047307.1 hydrogenase-1 operon protein HyaE [Rhodopseudomonas rhenobacensis]